MTTTTTAPFHPRIADSADEAIAGRPFPVRNALAPTTPDSARAHLRAIAAFWLAVAEGHLAMAEKGCTESIADGAEALLHHAHYSPRTA